MTCKRCNQNLIRLEADRTAPSSPFKQEGGGITWAYPVRPAPDSLCYTCHRHEFRRLGLTRGGQEIKQDERKEVQKSERKLVALGGRSGNEAAVIYGSTNNLSLGGNTV